MTSGRGLGQVTAARQLPAHVTYKERIGLGLILLGFAFLGVHNVLHEAYKGQDFETHVSVITEVINVPSRWFIATITLRPMIYWVAAGLSGLSPDTMGVRPTDGDAGFGPGSVLVQEVS
jgi:hypothetical protein